MSLKSFTFNKVSLEDNTFLTSEFSAEEIKVVVWSCDDSRSPGPDDVTFDFTKENWELSAPVNIIVGSHVWVEDPTLAWIGGEVTKISGENVHVRTRDGKTLKLVSKEDPWTERVDFLIEIMVSFFEKQQSQKEAINALPLYSNEQIMWDESVVSWTPNALPLYPSMKVFNITHLASLFLGVKLDNATTIATFDPNEKTYNINGKDVQGHFMVDYIWPVKPDNYLGPLTTLVSDAHKQGLEVYASSFANDFFSSYDYNYDPTAEYLQFIAKDECVDGLVTDFPSTASNSIACFALNNTLPKKGQPLIISNNGASGVYLGSTNLAYQQAIDDEADIIDCSVQMTKDGISFCSNTADLMADTTAMTKFMSRTSNVPEIQPNSGIFSFDLTWNEIQSLQRNASV
ncbi:unnamed protein product [Vicia faba]|uniref:glycerophosphodiester phosphodiesterase n=1 Tax=Vicia faba TaxID=3906 RepID=A0AAV1A3H8_VICFA|nr:unnamed protein product [Vicia faba]